MEHLHCNTEYSGNLGKIIKFVLKRSVAKNFYIQCTLSQIGFDYKDVPCSNCTSKF